MEKYTFTTGSLREGFNFIGNWGIRHRPKSDKQAKMRMVRIKVKN
jgi:hypothetical protein